MSGMIRPEDLLRPTPQGLYCPPGDFYIDPVRGGVDRAVVTHGHSDHARAGHGAVLATPETLEAMATRYGEEFTRSRQAAPYGETNRVGDVDIRLVPAGHVIGSAQVEVKWKGLTMVCTGDYKRRADPTCAPFEVIPCNIFISEATFALPVFRHPYSPGEVAKLLASIRAFPDRAHLVGAYAFGKAQRVIRELRDAGYNETIYIHGAMKALCDMYERLGVDLGALESATLEKKQKTESEKFAGALRTLSRAAAGLAKLKNSVSGSCWRWASSRPNSRWPAPAGPHSSKACARSSTSSATRRTAWRPTRARCRTSTA